MTPPKHELGTLLAVLPDKRPGIVLHAAGTYIESLMSIDAPAHPDAAFSITHEATLDDTLVIGLSQFGLAGLTAVNYLVDHLDLEQTGYLTTEQLPTITPFENGTPRRPTRLFSRSDLDLTFLLGELFVPVWAAESFSEAILDWTETNGVEEVVLLSGIPNQYGPRDDDLFYIATDEYRDDYLDSTDLTPMQGGFLDGVNAELISRGIDSPLAVGMYITPVRPPVPDIGAALRLVSTLDDIYEIDADTEPLEQFAWEVSQYYAELSDRMSTADDQDRSYDRMYM